MNIFDHIKTLFFKVKLTESLNDDSIQTFIPYMVTRWLSFYSKSQATIANEILNRYAGVFTDKYDTYKFYSNIIPKMPFKKISYIKKNKVDTTKEVEHLDLVANNLNISVRELKEYLELKDQLSK